MAYEAANNVTGYFHLKSINDDLVQKNVELELQMEHLRSALMELTSDSAGLERMKSRTNSHDQITYDVTFPYIRMAAGPVDYTQGAMQNYVMKYYKPNRTNPCSQGTRCRQLGMYVIFESPFNMLCDSPMHYQREVECTEFISKVPTVWDETVALDGKVGEFVAVARRSGDTWYVGGLTGHQGREITVDLSFLGADEWNIELYTDGVNAHRHGEDYKKTVGKVQGSLTVMMAPGGGFAAVLTK